MKPEIEAKFLNVNHDELRAKLKVAGASCIHPMRLMHRNMFDYPDRRFRDAGTRRLLRLRDEGDRVTLTYKDDGEGSYSHEAEITVNDFKVATQLLQEIGLELYGVFEQKREAWHFGDVEVMLDEWPWADPFIEIEGPTEPAIKAAADALGFDWADAKFGGPNVVYREKYPGMTDKDSINALSELLFGTELPEYFKERLQAKS